MALQDKLKYLRNQGRPKKRVSDQNESNSKPKRQKQEFKQYPQLMEEPPIPPDEDESSFQRNNKLLMSQEKKTNPNPQIINVLMRRTFPFRRRSILRSTLPVNEILKAHPSLRRIDQVIK